MKNAARIMGDLAIVAVDFALRDGTGILGACAITYGVWQIYSPAGWIVGGALLLTGAALYSRRG